MRVALLISGYLRSFKLNLPTIKEKIINQFDEVDIYIHITSNESEDDKYINSVDEDTLRQIQELQPKAMLQEPNYSLFTNPKDNDLANTWLKYYKLNELKKVNEFCYGEYDLVIKLRPDMNIISNDVIKNDIADDFVYIPRESLIDQNKLSKPNDPYLCDIFAYGKSKVMDTYFGLIKDIDELLEKYGNVPETILYQYLKNKVNVKWLDLKYTMILSTCNVFAICGDSGSGKTVLSDILSKYFKNSFTLECDRYHKWERNDENWSKYTHLNPEANYLTKMHQDVFDLKIGQSVYQVNYDHQNGKFAQSEKIESCDNIIMCGLHSLSHENDSIYNLKIFMDTDVNLRTQWKVLRDTKIRGYTKEKVLQQIESRKEDYTKYVYPQRAKSDLIIEFYTDEKFDPNNLEKHLPIYLRLHISKKYLISSIVKGLKESGIKFKIDQLKNDDFNTLTFKGFPSGDQMIVNGMPNGSAHYYNYILYTLFSLNKSIK